MRRCRSSLATRVSPIAGSDTRRSLDIWGLRAHGAEDAAEVEGRAAAGEAGDLVGEAGGAGERAAGGIVGEPLQDQAAQSGMQLRETLMGDTAWRHLSLAPELGVDQRIEQLGLGAQQRRRAQDVLLCRRVDLLQGRNQLAAEQVALVVGLLVARVVAPGQAALFAVGGGLRAGRPQ